MLRRDETEALLAMYNTNLCYRTKCPDTAMWMSRLTGQREIIEKREGFSYGANDIRDGVSVHQERRKEPLILDTQFLKLNDCEAYMLLPENTPVTKITLTAKSRTTLAAPLVPNDSLNVSLEQEIKSPPKASIANKPPKDNLDPLNAKMATGSYDQDVMAQVPKAVITDAMIPALRELDF
jgi:type IV secretory pathway TraG/TraD family ATPase VirD4